MKMNRFIGFGLWVLVVIGLFVTVRFTVQSYSTSLF